MVKWVRNSRWVAPVFFVCVFSLYMTLMPEPYFTDEQDVFYGGYNVVMSGDVYANYLSQHMPFSYYMAALPALLGARTVYQFRLGFYLMLSGIWTAVFVRHRKRLNPLWLALIPVIFILQLYFHDYATTMISDHWQGIGLAMILLELVRYGEEPRITPGMAGMISLGIVLSFGTTFLSAYPLLMLFLGAAAMQAVRLKGHPEERRQAAGEDLRLVGICLLPWALLAGWYAVSGNLGNAFGGAYTVNVEVYSQYIGGLGTSPGGTFLSVIPAWFASWGRAVSFLKEDPLYSIQMMLQHAAVPAFAVWTGVRRKNPALGIAVFLACVYTGVRAFDGFHGAAYMCMTSTALAGLIGDGIAAFGERRTAWRGLGAFAALAALVFLAAPHVEKAKNLYHAPRYLRAEQTDATTREMLEILTDEGDRIHVGDVSFTSNTVMKYNLRLDDAAMASGNPWFYAYWGERELETLKRNRTKVMLFDPEGELWGFRVRDYASDLVQYTEEAYVMIEKNLYVHRDALPEARRRLEEAGYGLIGTDTSSPADGLSEMLYEGETVEQVFPAAGSRMEAVWIQTATYVNRSRVGLTVALVDPESGETLAEAYRPKDQLRDARYTRFDMDAELTPGKPYRLRITADPMEEEEDTLVHLYRSGPDTDGENLYAVIYDEPVNYNIVMQIEYAVDDGLRIMKE